MCRCLAASTEFSSASDHVVGPDIPKGEVIVRFVARAPRFGHSRGCYPDAITGTPTACDSNGFVVLFRGPSAVMVVSGCTVGMISKDSCCQRASLTLRQEPNKWCRRPWRQAGRTISGRVADTANRLHRHIVRLIQFQTCHLLPGDPQPGDVFANRRLLNVIPCGQGLHPGPGRT